MRRKERLEPKEEVVTAEMIKAGVKAISESGLCDIETERPSIFPLNAERIYRAMAALKPRKRGSWHLYSAVPGA